MFAREPAGAVAGNGQSSRQPRAAFAGRPSMGCPGCNASSRRLGEIANALSHRPFGPICEEAPPNFIDFA